MSLPQPEQYVFEDQSPGAFEAEQKKTRAAYEDWLRTDRSEPPPKQPKRPVGRPKAKPGVFKVKMKVDIAPQLLLAIDKVRGNLSMEDCMVQLIEHALGELAPKEPTE